MLDVLMILLTLFLFLILDRYTAALERL